MLPAYGNATNGTFWTTLSPNSTTPAHSHACWDELPPYVLVVSSVFLGLVCLFSLNAFFCVTCGYTNVQLRELSSRVERRMAVLYYVLALPLFELFVIWGPHLGLAIERTTSSLVAGWMCVNLFNFFFVFGGFCSPKMHAFSLYITQSWQSLCMFFFFFDRLFNSTIGAEALFIVPVFLLGLLQLLARDSSLRIFDGRLTKREAVNEFKPLNEHNDVFVITDDEDDAFDGGLTELRQVGARGTPAESPHASRRPNQRALQALDDDEEAEDEMEAEYESEVDSHTRREFSRRTNVAGLVQFFERLVALCDALIEREFKSARKRQWREQLQSVAAEARNYRDNVFTSANSLLDSASGTSVASGNNNSVRGSVVVRRTFQIDDEEM